VTLMNSSNTVIKLCLFMKLYNLADISFCKNMELMDIPGGHSYMCNIVIISLE